MRQVREQAQARERAQQADREQQIQRNRDNYAYGGSLLSKGDTKPASGDGPRKPTRKERYESWKDSDGPGQLTFSIIVIIFAAAVFGPALFA
jgi:hypothetical protein